MLFAAPITPSHLRLVLGAIGTVAVMGAPWWGYSTIWDRGYETCQTEHIAKAAEAAAEARQDYLDAVARGDEISTKLAAAQAENRRLRNDLANDVDRLRGLCPAGLRLIHDAAATGTTLSEAARTSLDTPATVDARPIAQAIAGNYAECRGCIAQLNALIDWHESPTKKEEQ